MAQRPTHYTYIAGEESSRLQTAAQSLGLEARESRRPKNQVRAAVAAWFNDTTLEAARMHSVGTLGNDEFVDSSGTLHVRTLTVRRRNKSTGGEIPNYGTLQNLFKPLEVSEEDIEEIEEVIETVEGGSLTAAVFGIIKGMVGPAILYLPRGFQLSGWAVAIACMFVATVASCYSAMRLLQCWKVEKAKVERLEEIRALLQPDDEANVPKPASAGGGGGDPHAANVLLTYPELARRAFGKASIGIQLGIAAMQFGVCLTYLIFVPQNLVESFKNLWGVEVNKLVFLITMVLMEIPLSWVRDIRKLTPTNILATLLIAYGLLSCLMIAFDVTLEDPTTNLLKRIQLLPPVNDTWFLFVGTSFFVFEGSITLIVPLQEAVFRREDKEKFPMVYLKVTSSIVIFYIFFAITCLASFGGGVKTALTASLPEGNFATMVQMAYSIAVIFTFPLQAFPALSVVLNPSHYKTPSEVFKRNVISSLITCFLGVLAYFAIDYLGNVVSLLGSLVGIPIALIYPPLMHNRMVKDGSKITRILNLCVTMLGICAMCASSFTTIVSWEEGVEG